MLQIVINGVLAAFVGNRQSETLPDPSWKWRSTECQRLLAFHHGWSQRDVAVMVHIHRFDCFRMLKGSTILCASATTLVSVRNTRVLRTARTTLTEPRTLWRGITRFPSPRRRVRVYRADVVAFRCSCEHLGPRRITVEQSGKSIFFGNAAGAPGNHSNYLSFNDFQNLSIQFVSSSMYVCIYIATYLHTVYLDWQHVVSVSDWMCTWRWWSSGLGDTLRGRDPASVEMHVEAVIERDWRCNWRPRLSELRDALGGRDRASYDMHMEAVIERV